MVFALIQFIRILVWERNELKPRSVYPQAPANVLYEFFLVSPPSREKTEFPPPSFGQLCMAQG